MQQLQALQVQNAAECLVVPCRERQGEPIPDEFKEVIMDPPPIPPKTKTSKIKISPGDQPALTDKGEERRKQRRKEIKENLAIARGEMDAKEKAKVKASKEKVVRIAQRQKKIEDNHNRTKTNKNNTSQGSPSVNDFSECKSITIATNVKDSDKRQTSQVSNNNKKRKDSEGSDLKIDLIGELSDVSEPQEISEEIKEKVRGRKPEEGGGRRRTLPWKRSNSTRGKHWSVKNDNMIFLFHTLSTVI